VSEPPKKTRQRKAHKNIRNGKCAAYIDGTIKSYPDDPDMTRCIRCLSCLWIVGGEINPELLEYYRTNSLGQIKFALWLLETTFPGTLTAECLRLMRAPDAY